MSSDINEVKARLRNLIPKWGSWSAATFNANDVENLLADHDHLEAENAELARKAKCSDAMVEHSMQIWQEEEPGHPGFVAAYHDGEDFADGATPLEAVEAAVKALEGK